MIHYSRGADRFGKAVHGSFIHDVQRVLGYPRPSRRKTRGFRQALGISIGEREDCSALCKIERQCAANPGGRSGEGNDFTIKEIHRMPLRPLRARVPPKLTREFRYVSALDNKEKHDCELAKERRLRDEKTDVMVLRC